MTGPAHIITIGPTTINARHLIAIRDEGPAKDKRLVALYSAFGNQLQLVVTPDELVALRAAMGAPDGARNEGPT